MSNMNPHNCRREPCISAKLFANHAMMMSIGVRLAAGRPQERSRLFAAVSVLLLLFALYFYRFALRASPLATVDL
jgi:hypothetical protein